MPFLVDSVMGEIGERRLNVQLVAHPVFGVRRDGAKLVALGAIAAGGARESFIHIHLEPIAEEAARADIVRALESVLGEVRLAVQDWRAMLDRVNGMVDDLEDQSAAAAGGRDRRGDPVPAMAAGRQFHLPRRAQLHLRRQHAGARFRERARHHAFARFARAQARRRIARIHPGNHGVSQGTAPADHRQGQYPRARAPARLSRLCRHQAIRRFRQSGGRTTHRRAVHLHRLYAQRAQHSLSAPQDRGRRSARRLRRQQSFRQGAGQRAGTLSARRIVPGRRRLALSFRARHPAARRAAARARAGAARSLRPLRVGAGVRAARTLRQPHPRAHRRLSQPRLYRARLGVLSVLPGRPAGARALHHRPLPRPRARDRCRHAGARGRGNRALVGRRIERRAGAGQSAGQGARSVWPLPRRVFRGFPGSLSADGGGRRYPHGRNA